MSAFAQYILQCVFREEGDPPIKDARHLLKQAGYGGMRVVRSQKKVLHDLLDGKHSWKAPGVLVVDGRRLTRVECLRIASARIANERLIGMLVLIDVELHSWSRHLLHTCEHLECFHFRTHD